MWNSVPLKFKSSQYCLPHQYLQTSHPSSAYRIWQSDLIVTDLAVPDQDHLWKAYHMEEQTQKVCSAVLALKREAGRRELGHACPLSLSRLTDQLRCSFSPGEKSVTCNKRPGILGQWISLHEEETWVEERVPSSLSQLKSASLEANAWSRVPLPAAPLFQFVRNHWVKNGSLFINGEVPVLKK